MKQLAAMGYWISIFILLLTFTGCVSGRKSVLVEKELNIKGQDRIVAIKGAPDWVNNGSSLFISKERRVFHGVASAMSMGDLALQKAVADDRARDAIARVVPSYLLVMAGEYAATLRTGEAGASRVVLSDETMSRQMTEAVKTSFSATRIIGSWRDPGTNNIWSIAELELKYVKSSIADAMDMNADLKRYIDTSAESIFDRIVRESSRAASAAE